MDPDGLSRLSNASAPLPHLLPLADSQSAVYTLVFLASGTLPWLDAASAVLELRRQGNHYSANLGPEMRACLEGEMRACLEGGMRAWGLGCMHGAWDACMGPGMRACLEG